MTGARQIGKTWLIRDEIEKSGYTKFEVNFIDQPDMVSYLNAEMSAEDFLIKLKTVSYTHLDVYKRQDVTR